MATVTTADSLDAAWAEAEAALPEGWVIELGNYENRWYWAQALGREVNGVHPRHAADARTPAEALRALLKELRESQP